MRSAPGRGRGTFRVPGRFLRTLDRPITYTWVTALFAVGAWELYSRDAGGLLIPTVGDIAGGMGTVVTDPDVWAAFARSNLAMVAGYALSIIVGVPLGLLLGRFRSADRAAAVYIGILLVTPMAAISPLLLMAFGLTATAQIVLVFIFAVVMVIVNSRAGVRQVDPSVIEMARSYLAGEGQVWRHVLLRGALPGIMAGLQLGLGRAVQGMVIGELLLVAAGIGGLILNYSARYQAGELYAVIILVIVEALLLSALLYKLEARLVPWLPNRGRRRQVRILGAAAE